ncbi:MAG: hypothetical protein ACXVB0_01795 [Mucilaginibacter sp.]
MPAVNLLGKWTTTADTLRIYHNGTLEETDVFTGKPIELSNYQFNQDGSLKKILSKSKCSQ